MSEDNAPAAVAAAYFQAWRDGDVEGVRPLLHDDVDFVGAMGKTHGIEETLRGLGGMFAMTRRVAVVHRWVHGPRGPTGFGVGPDTARPTGLRHSVTR